MRGRGWIKEIRRDEARRVRARIAELECELMAASSKGRRGRFEAGHELRNAKSRLELLEDCLADMDGKTVA